jgi:hypothetical protein
VARERLPDSFDISPQAHHQAGKPANRSTERLAGFVV